MKHFRVSIAPDAERDIAAEFWYIHRDSPSNAETWMHGIYAAIESLAMMPARCGRICEHAEFDVELREMYYKSHRIIFTIVGEEVRVVHVRHGAPRDIQRADISD